MREVRSHENWKSDRPYAPAIAAGGMLFLAGHVPVDSTGGTVLGDSRTQAVAVLKNLDRTLRAGGFTRNDIVATTVYLTDMAGIGGLDQAYREFFGAEGPYPSRTTVEISSLGRAEFTVEISAIAVAAERR